MVPSRNDNTGRRSHSPFFLPTHTKGIVCLTMLVAVVSVIRIHPKVNSYCDAMQLIAPTESTHIAGSSSYFGIKFVYTGTSDDAVNKRLVFYRPEAPPTLPNGPSLPDKLEAESSTYLRFASSLTYFDSEDNAADITRRYVDADSSSDYPDMEQRLWPEHEFDPHCKPSASWQNNFHPVCNDIHGYFAIEEALASDQLVLLSNKGFWRHAWKYREGGFNETDIDPATISVLKTFKINHNFEEKYFEDNRVDAVAMERLTGSPFIIDIFGFCGLTVVQEFAGRELAHVIDQERLNSTQKLELAKKITQGLADIHSIEDDEGRTDRPTLVHNDLNLANLMFTSDNRPVHNDFNIAILLMTHNETKETCPFFSHFPNPQWKSPEEQVLDDGNRDPDEDPPIVNEKIDIYALGNVFYRMIAGSSPWKRPEAKKVYPEEKIVIAKLKQTNGTLPSVPVEIVGNATYDNDPALAALYEAMQLCYSFRASDRPSAPELIDFLDDAIETSLAFDYKHAAYLRAVARNATSEPNNDDANSVLLKE